ncbi:hypothetical protein ACEUZ9_005351 [Paracoccus litorisediminis]|uniref:hypothetical protein n=1 Tax=Paracoccus litorisediminis TaxID=2006130 RepID=UPI003730049D
MNDLDTLNKQQRMFLQIKLDGHVEACVLAARAQALGRITALSLTVAAMLREMGAYGLSREQAEEIWSKAFSKAYPDSQHAELVQ